MERFAAEVTRDSHAQRFLQKREEAQVEFLCAWSQRTEQPSLGKRVQAGKIVMLALSQEEKGQN